MTAAYVLVSFGGPEGPDEVLPFLRRVTAGRGIPDERLTAVGAHYDLFGGKSPINDANRQLLADLRAELDRRGDHTPLLWGNRNASPFLADTFRDAAGQGIDEIRVVLTSAWRSYSSCRQYRENLAEAQAEAGTSLRVTKVAPLADHPSYAAACAAVLDAAVGHLIDAGRRPQLLFVTHSVPTAMDDASGDPRAGGHAYATCQAALAEQLRASLSAAYDVQLEGELVYCSRSGPPTQPWLEPDVNDRLEQLAEDGVTDVALVPIGFISDHMEVVYDLDVEAAATCERLGLRMVRVPTVGTEPIFVAGVADLLAGPASICPPDCCANLRGPRPALCGSDPR
jgi:ferrochelatase